MAGEAGHERLDSSWIDPQTLAALRDLIEARGLVGAEQQMLQRAVTGAVRPNRDRPVWDLCWLVRDLSAVLATEQVKRSREDRLLEVLLDQDAAARKLAARTFHGGRERKWQRTQTRALCAFGEFLLSHEDCLWFKETRASFAAIIEAPEVRAEVAVRDAVALISQRLRRFRVEKFAIGSHEKTVRAIVSFMAARGRSAATYMHMDDEDVLAFWEHSLTEDRVLFRTCVQHVIAFRVVMAEHATQRALTQAVALDEGRGSRDDDAQHADMDEADDPVDITCALDVQNGPDANDLAALLADGLPDDVKVLTGTERDKLLELVTLHEITRDLPLTTLRVLSFGAVQSGIANRLRRGSGGGSIAERAACRDAATYADLVSQYDRLKQHVDRLLLIAGHLARPSDDDSAAQALQAQIAERAERALRQVQRAGFDGDRARLADVFSRLATSLVQLAGMVDIFTKRARRVERDGAIDARFARDRERFARDFTRAYVVAASTELQP